jgi:hypothetical protein
MEDAFWNWLHSAWPVLLPTVAVIIAYLSLRNSNREHGLRLDRNNDSNKETQLLIGLSEAHMKAFIDQRINGKLERIHDTLERLEGRQVAIERSVSALEAIQRGIGV